MVAPFSREVGSDLSRFVPSPSSRSGPWNKRGPRCGAEKFIWDDDNTYGGKFVVNPSGGLLSKGHPLGATGLAQCTELVWHLRGTAGERQVPNAKVALQHNLGLGGACVMTMYKKN